METDGNMTGFSQEEVSKLTRAMKDKTFHNHLDDYCKEISDPKHRREYLQYLDQLEAKGEMPDGQVLLRAEPGCCVKTSISFKNGQVQKCFINIVHSERLEDMTEVDDETGGKRVHVPYSLGPPRPERDNKDENCMTADFAISTWTFGQAIQRPQILKILVDTASEGLQRQFLKGHEEVKKDFKIMRRIKCRGPGARPIPMSVKGELLKDKGTSKKPVMNSVAAKDSITPSELREMRKEAKEKQLKPRKQEDDVEEVQTKAQDTPEPETTSTGGPRIRVPKHKLVHSGAYNLTDFMESSNRPTMLAQSIPRTLRLVVELPTVKKSADISLDVTSTNVCIEVPEKYYLDLPLTYEIDEAKGDAKFDKVKQTLTLELPVIPKLPDPELLANRHGFASGIEDEGDADADDDEAGCQSDDGSEKDLSHPEGNGPAESSSTVVQAEMEGEEAAANGDEHIDTPSKSMEATLPTSSGGSSSSRSVASRTPASAVKGTRAPANPDVASRATAALALAAGVEEPWIEEMEDMKDIGNRCSFPIFKSASKSAGRSESKLQENREAPQPLPGNVQHYLDTTALLTSRIAATSIHKSHNVVEASLDWQQTRQNFMLLIDIPVGNEVAGLQLSLVGRRLAIMFCTRPVGSEAWHQQCIRRTLCRAVDARQWHAELPKPHPNGIGAGTPLVLILRKLEQGDKWVEAFDTSVAIDPVMDNIEVSECFATSGGQEAAVEQGAADTAAGIQADVPAAVEDSAELDIAAPTVHGVTGSDIGSKGVASPAPLNPSLASAAAQSAMVMGQAVLLRTRLMYELF
jgi:dynein assembly factor 2